MSQKLEEGPPLGKETDGHGTSDRRRPVARPDLVKEVHLRIPLTIAIPAIAIVAVAVVALLFGLFLLNLPHEHAPAVALALSVNILAAATYAASRPKLTGRTIAELAILVVYPVLLAVVLVNLGVGEPVEAVAEGAAPAAEAAAAGPTTAEISAENLQFSTDELTFPADEEVILIFDNQDVAPHNVAIYGDDTLKEKFFIGAIIEGGESIDYDVPALAAGPYYFRCDVHPSMDGRLIVE